MLRARETLLWLFVMPILFSIHRHMIGGFDGPAGDPKDPLAVRGADGAGFLADEFLRRLEAQNFEIRR